MIYAKFSHTLHGNLQINFINLHPICILSLRINSWEGCCRCKTKASWVHTVNRKWCSVIKIPTNATMMTEIMIPREKANETFLLRTPRGRKSGKVAASLSSPFCRSVVLLSGKQCANLEEGEKIQFAFARRDFNETTTTSSSRHPPFLPPPAMK